MGQQHSQNASLNCPQVFKCWHSEDVQGTPYKQKSEERFIYDIDVKDLFVSNKEKEKWLKEQPSVPPFQNSTDLYTNRISNQAQRVYFQKQDEGNIESGLLLPQYSCKKQLFAQNNNDKRYASIDTTEETLRNHILDSFKENSCTINFTQSKQMNKYSSQNKPLYGLSEKRSTTKSNQSRLLSIDSDFLTLHENSVVIKTPCSESWKRFLYSMNKTKFLKSNKVEESKNQSNSEKRDHHVIDFLNANYIGSVEGNIPNGYGEVRYHNGDVQFGYFEKNICQGKGKYIKKDGTFFEGTFVNGEACGFGSYISADGYRYEGDWKFNKPCGKGKVTYSDLSIYQGYLVQGKRHGEGCFLQNGCKYQGEFRDDRIQGNATMTYDNGESYKGEWKSDVIDGYGEYIWPNGDRYVGNYKRGKRDGSGVMYYQNGDMFTGNWRNGMKDGQGTFTSNSTTKTGNWVRSQYVEQIRSQ